ncbi:unnamed protein product, partial [Bubo scandiacus]
RRRSGSARPVDPSKRENKGEAAPGQAKGVSVSSAPRGAAAAAARRLAWGQHLGEEEQSSCALPSLASVPTPSKCCGREMKPQATCPQMSLALVVLPARFFLCRSLHKDAAEARVEEIKTAVASWRNELEQIIRAQALELERAKDKQESTALLLACAQAELKSSDK